MLIEAGLYVGILGILGTHWRVRELLDVLTVPQRRGLVGSLDCYKSDTSGVSLPRRSLRVIDARLAI